MKISKIARFAAVAAVIGVACVACAKHPAPQPAPAVHAHHGGKL